MYIICYYVFGQINIIKYLHYEKLYIAVCLINTTLRARTLFYFTLLNLQEISR